MSLEGDELGSGHLEFWVVLGEVAGEGDRRLGAVVARLRVGGTASRP